MTIIRPITDLRNTNAISELCHKSKDPVFITKNGYGDMVVMSMDAYEAIDARLQTLTAALTAEVSSAASFLPAQSPTAVNAAASSPQPISCAQPPVAPACIFSRGEEPESDERTPDEDFGGLRVIREKYLKTKTDPLSAR